MEPALSLSNGYTSCVGTICTFGFENRDATRAWVLREGLKAHGMDVVECRSQARGLFAKTRALVSQMKTMKCDAMLVMFPGHYLVPLAWMIARKRKIPLVFDAFISLHDTMVHDRRVVSRFSPRAWMLRVVDRWSCALADVVLVDTEEHASFFEKKIGVPQEKLLVIPVGYRTDVFMPSPLPKRANGDPLLVHFHGTFIPLQGIETIMHAMHLLSERKANIHLRIVGGGQTSNAIRSLSEKLGFSNTEFFPFVPLEQLGMMLREAHVGLGIFGTTEKALRVIPHKAYETIGSGRPLVTAGTPASKRVFQNNENALLVEPGNPEALAATLERLEKEPALLEKLAVGSVALSSSFQPDHVTAPLFSWLSTHLR